jgi:3-mercaptopyruvate sulfurtransferase SseA
MMLIAALACATAGVAFAQAGPGRASNASARPEPAEGRIGAAELKKLYDAGQVVVLDVRGAAAYRDSHIAGALSVPLDTVAQRAAELKASGKAFVTYCT